MSKSASGRFVSGAGIDCANETEAEASNTTSSNRIEGFRFKIGTSMGKNPWLGICG